MGDRSNFSKIYYEWKKKFVKKVSKILSLGLQSKRYLLSYTKTCSISIVFGCIVLFTFCKSYMMYFIFDKHLEDIF